MSTSKAAPGENSMGIPKAEFVSDVAVYMKKNEGKSVEIVLKELDELYSKYKMMEVNVMQKKKSLGGKIPEISGTLDAIKYLLERQEQGLEGKPIRTSFDLADNAHATAEIHDCSKVCLWLGANVMLEYDIEEARDLLATNLKTARENNKQVDIDLEFIREQITVMEVNMARVYNWDVKRRREVTATSS